MKSTQSIGRREKEGFKGTRKENKTRTFKKEIKIKRQTKVRIQKIILKNRHKKKTKQRQKI